MNWQPIWFVAFSEEPARNRLEFFNQVTSTETLVFGPICLGLAIAVSLPFIKLFGLYSARMPLRLIRQIQYDSSQSQRIYELEASLAENRAQANHDQELDRIRIESAKILEEAKITGGPELEKEILEDREERLALQGNISNTALQLLALASTDRNGKVTINSSKDGKEIFSGNHSARLDHRGVTKINAAIAELETRRLFKNGVNEITEQGYRKLESEKATGMDIDHEINSLFLDLRG